MTTGGWVVDIDRVVVTGASAKGLDAAEVQALVADAVAGRLTHAALPTGRAVRSSVRIESAAVSPTAAGVASAVSTAVTAAVQGGAPHG